MAFNNADNPDSGVQLPDLTGNPDTGVPLDKPQTAQQVALAAAQQSSPQNILQQQWRPGTFLDFHTQITGANAPQAARNLDTAIHQAYQNDATIVGMIASRQAGSVTVTGSILNIPTGLKKVSQCSGSIDQGSVPHNFWLSIVPSATPGAIDIYVWQPTAAGNNTPIACTTAVKVRWIANGSFT